MKQFRQRNLMETLINNLKLKGINEDDIYKSYLDGKNLENGEEEISQQQIEVRVEYLTKMTETYLDLW